MRGKYIPHHILEVVLLVIALAGFSASSSKANENSKYLDAVIEFADNVLKYGRDTYGPKHTPLFVDGLNIYTHEPVKWIAPNGDRWILSNLASQQNLFRTLDGLTKITGDPKYKQAAVEAIEYAFENLRSPNGLLYWGIGTAYDVRREAVFGWRLGKGYQHCLKDNLPYYELMWQVNPEATKMYIESFWSAHILNWSNLDMNRWVNYGDIKKPSGNIWRHEYKGGPVFLESGRGAFLPTGVDLIYAAAWLTKLSGEKDPLVWVRRIAHRYVRTRHSNTGISYGMYTLDGIAKEVQDSYDDVVKKLATGTKEVRLREFPRYHYTNPIYREVICGNFTPTPGISVHQDLFYWLSQLLVGEMLAGEGDELSQWALEELTAFGKASYRGKDNVYIPILTDGTNLEGYVVKEDGPLGPKGVTLESLPAGPSDFWVYALGYCVTNDVFMWEMTRNISRGNEFGDIGATPSDSLELNFGTDCSDPYALLAFLELHRAIGKNDFLKIAKKIGDNIFTNRFHKGFFVASNKHIYTKFDAIDSLALLHLQSALAGEIAAMPQAWPCLPRFCAPYRGKDQGIDNTIIYTLTESPEPPMSLQEAAAIGDIELVRSLLDEGVGVNNIDDALKKTALHRAVIGGHTDVVKLLLTKGADVDARVGTSGPTLLHHPVENGHLEIAELLLAHGADANAKDAQGRTPLDLAMERGHRGIIRLLSKSGDVSISINMAAYAGDLQRVEKFIDEGADVDAKDEEGQTALHYAAKGADIEMVELLIAKGADVNAKDNRSRTPLYVAVWGGHTDVVEFLIDNGADINARSEYNYTPIYHASWSGSTEMVEFLVKKGADVNAKDVWGWTPLHYLAKDNLRDMAEFFITKGADVNAEDEGGKTPLQVAEREGHTEIVELLRKHGAKEEEAGKEEEVKKEDEARKEEEATVAPPEDIKKKAYAYQMPLHKAAAEADLERVKSLISDGANVNAESNEGWTALHRAAVFGHTDVVKLLLGHGADVTTVNMWGWTPLHSAALYGHKAVVELLLANGADISAKTPAGETSLHIAIERGYKEIAELLCKPEAKEDKSPQTAPK